MLTLDVFASEVPAWRFAEVFSQKTGWTVKVEDSIRDVRLFAHWRDAPPAQMLETLTVLLNSRQDVTISRSDAQKREEEKQLEEAFDQRTWEEKASESLLPELVQLLTPEERAQWLAGEEVSISLTRIQGELFTRVYDYVTKRFETILGLPVPADAKLPQDLLTRYEDIASYLPHGVEGSLIIGVRVTDRANNRDYRF